MDLLRTAKVHRRHGLMLCDEWNGLWYQTLIQVEGCTAFTCVDHIEDDVEKRDHAVLFDDEPETLYWFDGPPYRCLTADELQSLIVQHKEGKTNG